MKPGSSRNISPVKVRIIMISLYQLFKIIFGIIISAFILVVAVYFINSYTGLQEDSQRAAALKSFLKAAGDVYVTGNSVEFQGFSGRDVFLSYDLSEPEGLVSQSGKTPVYFPLFLSPGEELFLYRGELDLGWWKFRFVEALPRTRIVFNLLEPDTGIAGEIASLFPDSEFFSPKTTFGICDGSLLREACGGECERQAFLFSLLSEAAGSRCSVRMPEGSVLVTISRSCSPSFSQGFCVSPPDQDGIGAFYISGDRNAYLYKDPLDIAAAIIGGKDKDIYGNYGGTMYQYKNSLFRRELLLASRVMANRALLLGSLHPLNSECSLAFSEFLNSMKSLESSLSDPGYYTGQAAAGELVSHLREARSAYQNLADRGCD